MLSESKEQMTNEGFICVSRSIVSHWIWNNPVYFQRWVDMIMMANWEDKEVQIAHHQLTVQRGQFVTALHSLAVRWSISRQAVSKFMVKLSDDKMVDTLVYGKVTIVTICNYDRYQLKNGIAVDGLVDNMVNSSVEELVAQTNNIIREKEKGKKTSDEVFSQVSLKPDPPSGMEGEVSLFDERFIQFFNSKMNGKAIPSIRGEVLGKKRKQSIKARMREYGKDAVAQVIANAAESNFLNGCNVRGFVASIDWLMKPGNFPKVLDGNYNNKNTKFNNVHDRTRRSEATATSSADFSKQF